MTVHVHCLRKSEHIYCKEQHVLFFKFICMALIMCLCMQMWVCAYEFRSLREAIGISCQKVVVSHLALVLGSEVRYSVRGPLRNLSTHKAIIFCLFWEYGQYIDEPGLEPRRNLSTSASQVLILKNVYHPAQMCFLIQPQHLITENHMVNKFYKYHLFQNQVMLNLWKQTGSSRGKCQEWWVKPSFKFKFLIGW